MRLVVEVAIYRGLGYTVLSDREMEIEAGPTVLASLDLGKAVHRMVFEAVEEARQELGRKTEAPQAEE